MRKLLLFTLLLMVLSASSQEGDWFKQRDFGKYFTADHYSPITKVGFGWSPLHDEYIVYRSRESGGWVNYNEDCVGTEIPLWYKKTEKNIWSVSLPFSFVIWMDYSEINTSPVLNTDYRFASPEINYLRFLEGKQIRNYNIKFYPLFHESTHIGDEMTVSRMQDSLPLTRINVSYETTDLSIQFNDPIMSVDKNLSFRIGFRALLNKNKGWYFNLPNEADTLKVFPSKRWIEPYLQLHFQRPSTKKLFKQKIMLDISADLRYRVQFSYPSYEFGVLNTLKETQYDEKYAPCINTNLGMRFINSDNELSPVGIYLRAYYGINYHGQFRNIPGFMHLGAALVYHQ